jgi:hypothetical protein
MNTRRWKMQCPPAASYARANSPLLFAMGMLLMLALACSTGGTPTPDSAALTGAALDAEATALSAQFQQLTEQAAAPTEGQPVAAPTEAPPPTESPYIEGSMVRATYDPAAGLGEPDIYEDFEGSSGHFATLSGFAASSWYGNGRYNITFITRGMWTWYFSDISAVDFYADVLVFNGAQCIAEDSAGLLFRSHQAGDFALLFGLTCDGGYYLGASGGPGPEGGVCTWTGTPNLIGPCPKEVSEPSDLIDAGPGAVNRLGIMAQGTRFSFYINGHQVDEYANPWTGMFFDEGFFGLFLGAAQKDDASASFDDFSFWKNP